VPLLRIHDRRGDEQVDRCMDRPIQSSGLGTRATSPDAGGTSSDAYDTRATPSTDATSYSTCRSISPPVSNPCAKILARGSPDRDGSCDRYSDAARCFLTQSPSEVDTGYS
jgi:hypothetical protein